MAEYTIQVDDTSFDAHEVGASNTLPIDASWETTYYLHPPEGESADSRSDLSSALSTDPIAPSNDGHDVTAEERRRMRRVQIVRKSRQRKEEALEQARREIEKYRGQASRWEELQKYTKTWLGAAHWLSKHHEPVTLYSNAIQATSETTRSPSNILVQTQDIIGLSLLSDLLGELTLTSDDLLQAWMPSEAHEVGRSSAKPRAKSGRKPRTEPSSAGDGGLSEAQRKQRAYTRACNTKKAAKEAEIQGELAAFRSQLPTIRACEQFVGIWQKSLESIFDDFQGDRPALNLWAIFDDNESVLPVPSGIVVEISEAGSRLLSQNWAGESLESSLPHEVQNTVLAMPDPLDPFDADGNDNGSGSSLTANSLAALQTELLFQGLMKGTALDPNYTGN